jgi:PhnB protein
MHNPDGSIAHVEVRIGTSIVMLFDSYEGWPKTPGFFRLYLEDADASYEQALRAGATSVTEVTELFWGDRVGRVRDPFGNIWWLQSHRTDVPYDEMQTRMGDPEMVEAMRYVQQTLVDALREQASDTTDPASAIPLNEPLPGCARGGRRACATRPRASALPPRPTGRCG